jgi:hypothetical protein
VPNSDIENATQLVASLLLSIFTAAISGGVHVTAQELRQNRALASKK